MTERQEDNLESHFVEGDLIRMRELRLSDVNETYYRWMNDSSATRYLESRFFPQSKEDILEYVRVLHGKRDSVIFALILKEDGRHIGNIKLGNINWVHRHADVGMLIGEKDCWSRGVGREAMRLITDYAFGVLNLNHLTGGIYATNSGSLRMTLKSGWREEGRRREMYFSDGAYVDSILVGVLRSEWEAERGKRKDQPGDSGSKIAEAGARKGHCAS